MTLSQIEKKIEHLERAVEELSRPQRSGQWWVEQAGQFRGDPVYHELARRGRAYRNSLKPKRRKSRG